MMPLKKSSNKLQTKLVFDSLGTSWEIEFYLPLNITKEAIFKNITALLEAFDKNYSRFRSDSWVNSIRYKKGNYLLPSDAKPMMDIYNSLNKNSGGLFTPLIGNSLEDAGYDAKYTLKPKKNIRKTPSWENALEYKWPILTLKQPALLDFGAIGKGYGVDLVAKILESFGVAKYCIDAGGDICCKDNKSQIIGLENPDNPLEIIGEIKLRNQSICGSSGSRRKWQNFHHIINPQTNSSPDQIKAVWVTAKNTMLADALATALFFVDPLKLIKLYDFDYLIIDGNNNLKQSASAEFKIHI